METTPPKTPSTLSLEALLNRQDIWRGYSRSMAPPEVLNSGYEPLNAALLGGGWPLGSFIEVCQQGFVQAEWQLFAPALLAPHVVEPSQGLLVLLNPPCNPFVQFLIKAGVDLNRLLVVETHNKMEFIRSFIELARAGACDAVLSWQPQQAFTYTELRKLLLAANEGQGLYVVFRPAAAREQSSPASLRLSISLNAQHLIVSIFKQKGELGIPSHPLLLPLPSAWQGFLPRHLLDQASEKAPSIAKVTPLHVSR